MRVARLGDLVIGERPVFVATSLADTVEEMSRQAERALAAGADCVELRIDRLPSTRDVVELIRATDAPHIVACRPPVFGGAFAGAERERIERLEGAIEAGATAVDIEFLTDSKLRDRLIDTARSHETPVLVGYEDMSKTPPAEELVRSLEAVNELRPDLVKLAVRAQSYTDLLTVLETVLKIRTLLDVPFAAIALGPHGAPSRPLACLFGSSFTYCAVESGAVPGQLTVDETRQVIEMLSEERWSC